jgi:hypothetical protein
MEHGDRNGLHPSLKQIYRSLISLRYTLLKTGREYSYFESVKNRLESLAHHRVFDCSRGMDIEDLVSANTLIRCRGLGVDEYALIVNDTLLRLAAVMPPTQDPPKLVVVLEEIHRMTNPERLRKADVAEAIVTDAMRTLAKSSVMLVCVDQIPHLLPPQILANSFFRATFSLFEARDLDCTQRSVGLSAEQREALRALPRGACVVHYANPKCPTPFVVGIPDWPLREYSAEEISARQRRSLAVLPWESSHPEAAVDNSPQVEAVSSTKATSNNRQRSPLISKHALDYLIEIAKNQFLPVSRRDQELGIGYSQGNGLRRELLNGQLIEQATVDTHSSSKKIVNTRITEKGYALLSEMKITFEKPRGKARWEHCWHQNAIAQWARARGYHALIEHMHQGKSVDVSIDAGDRRIGAEILVSGIAKELANLRDLLDYDEIWFCVADLPTSRALEAKIREAFGLEAPIILERVRFKLFREFQRADGGPQGGA